MGKPKVMVAVSDTHSVESLATLACQLASGMAGDLIALHVVEVPLATPLEAPEEVLDHPGKELLSEAKRVAERFSIPISTHLVRAREVGEAIVDEAKDQGAELLVMGHHRPGHHTMGEILLGSTVRYVAHHAPCRVIVQIPPPQQG
jgi:nucleotide-binding universal stress UspA family protein